MSHEHLSPGEELHGWSGSPEKDPDLARLTKRADEALEYLKDHYLDGRDPRRAKQDAYLYAVARFGIDSLTVERYPFYLQDEKGNDLIAADTLRWAEAIFEVSLNNWHNLAWVLHCEAFTFSESSGEDFQQKGEAIRNLAESLP